MTRVHLTIVVSILLALLSPGFALGQQAVPNPYQWADLLTGTGTPAAPTTPAALSGRDNQSDSADTTSDLERIAREVKIVLLPIIDQSGDRDIAVEKALEQAASTIDYYLTKYRDRLAANAAPSVAVNASLATLSDNQIVPAADGDAPATPLPVTDDITSSVDDDVRSREIISAAAVELRRIAAELDAMLSRDNSNN